MNRELTQINADVPQWRRYNVDRLQSAFTGAKFSWLSYPRLSVFIRGCFLTASALSETIYLDPVPRSRAHASGYQKPSSCWLGRGRDACRNSANDRIERHRNGGYRRAAHKTKNSQRLRAIDLILILWCCSLPKVLTTSATSASLFFVIDPRSDGSLLLD